MHDSEKKGQQQKKLKQSDDKVEGKKGKTKVRLSAKMMKQAQMKEE